MRKPYTLGHEDFCLSILALATVLSMKSKKENAAIFVALEKLCSLQGKTCTQP